MADAREGQWGSVRSVLTGAFSVLLACLLALTSCGLGAAPGAMLGSAAGGPEEEQRGSPEGGKGTEASSEVLPGLPAPAAARPSASRPLDALALATPRVARRPQGVRPRHRAGSNRAVAVLRC